MVQQHSLGLNQGKRQSACDSQHPTFVAEKAPVWMSDIPSVIPGVKTKPRPT